MLFGHDIYVFYGSRRSKLGAQKGVKLLSYIGLSIATLLAAFVVVHQSQSGWGEITVFSIVLLIIAIGHMALYGIRLRK
jgi:high-affinity Fe2+/Pb2+ permease